jgi:hypothetical protein
MYFVFVKADAYFTFDKKKVRRMKILVKSTQKELEPRIYLSCQNKTSNCRKKLLQSAFKQREGKSPTLYITSYQACVLFKGTPI